MSTDPELTRIVGSWLKADEHESADRVLSAVFDRLEVTPQRRPMWQAWRKNFMSGTLKLIAAGTVVVLVAAIALGVYLSRPAIGPGGSPSPEPSPTRTPGTPAPSSGETASPATSTPCAPMAPISAA